jgi:hypothetical protein
MKKIWWFGYGGCFAGEMEEFLDLLYARPLRKAQSRHAFAAALWRRKLVRLKLCHPFKVLSSRASEGSAFCGRVQRPRFDRDDNDVKVNQMTKSRVIMADTRAFCATSSLPSPIAERKRSAMLGRVLPTIALAQTSRTPAKILAHVGDLMDWGLAMSEGRREWHDSAPLRGKKNASASSPP